MKTSLVICTCLLFARLTQAQAPSDRPAATDHSLSLARELYEEHDYAHARTEVLRCLERQPETPGARDLLTAIHGHLAATNRAGSSTPSMFARATQRFIFFYRTQVSPAIGDCRLHPSCSQYFVEACSRHGLLGFPMLADRFFREPDVLVHALRHPDSMIDIDGALLASDPLSAHDFWFAPSANKRNAP